MKYYAFISYRHADNRAEGRKWATWLHQAIEAYEVPADLVGTTNDRGVEIPAQIFPVFRDEEELPADADLGGAITKALDASGLLVVLCSPRAVASTYVAEEIDYYKTLGRSDRIIAALIDGEPNCSWDASKTDLGFSPSDECFPLPLQFEYGDDGKPSEKRAEPIAADFRVNIKGTLHEGWTNTEALRQHLKSKHSLDKEEISKLVEDYQQQLHLMLLKVIAGILGVPLGLLTQRDKEFQLAQARRKAAVLRRWLMAVGVLAIVAAGAGVLAYINQQEALKNEKIANEQTVIAQANEKLAKERRDAALVTQSRFLMDQARQANEDGDYDTALLLGLNAVPGTHGGDRPEVPFLSELRHAAMNTDKHLQIYRENMQSEVGLSPDGTVLAIPERRGPSYLWSIETGEQLGIYSEDKNQDIHQSIFSKDGKIIASSSMNNIYIWSTETQQPLITFRPEIEGFAMLRFIALSSDGKKIAAVTGNAEVFVFNVSDGKQIFHTKVTDAEGFTFYVNFDEKGTYVYAVFGNNDVYVWTVETGKLILTAKSAANNILSSKWTRRPFITKEGLLFTFDSDGVKTWDLNTGEEKLIIKDYHFFASPEGKNIVYLPPRTTSFNQTPEQNEKAKRPILSVSETKTNYELVHSMPVNDVIFSPDGNLFLTLDSYNSWALWSSKSGNKIKTYTSGEPTHVYFTKDSKHIVSIDASEDLVTIWNVETAWENIPFANLTGFGSNDWISPIAGSLSYLMTTRVDSDPKNNIYALNFWSLNDGHLIKSQPLKCSANNKLSTEGRYLASKCYNENTWNLFSMETGEKVLDKLWGNNTFIYSKNEQYVASQNFSEIIGIWSIAGREMIYDFDGDTQIKAMAFTNDVNFFITADENGIIQRWPFENIANQSFENLDPKNGLILNTLTEEVDRLFINTDDSALAVQLEKGDVVLLSVSTGQLIRKISTEKKFKQVGFTPKGDHLFTLTDEEDATLTFWPVHSITEPTIIRPVYQFTEINFHPDGDLFTLTNFQTPSIWSLKSAKKFLAFQFVHQIRTLDFSKDGKYILAITGDGSIQKWPLFKEDLVATAYAKLPINRHCLTDREREKFFLPPLTEPEKKARSC